MVLPSRRGGVPGCNRAVSRCPAPNHRPTHTRLEPGDEEPYSVQCVCELDGRRIPIPPRRHGLEPCVYRARSSPPNLPYQGRMPDRTYMYLTP